MNRGMTLAALAAVLSLGIAACDKQGPAERAGEKLDHAVDTVKNGGEEPASDKLEDAAQNVKDAAKQTVDDVKEKTN